MSKRRHWGIEFNGFKEYAERLDKLDGDLKQITEECLEFIPDMVNPGLISAIDKHERTGKTRKSIIEGQKVEWNGNCGSIQVGLKISNGGLPALFLMYGTKPHTPCNQFGRQKGTNPGIDADEEIYDALWGRKINNKIHKKQKEIFEKAIKERMEGG